MDVHQIVELAASSPARQKAGLDCQIDPAQDPFLNPSVLENPVLVGSSDLHTSQDEDEDEEDNGPPLRYSVILVDGAKKPSHNSDQSGSQTASQSGPSQKYLVVVPEPTPSSSATQEKKESSSSASTPSASSDDVRSVNSTKSSDGEGSKNDEKAFLQLERDYVIEGAAVGGAIGVGTGYVLAAPTLFIAAPLTVALGGLIGGGIGLGVGKMRQKIALLKHYSDHFKKFPKPHKHLSNNCAFEGCTETFKDPKSGISGHSCGLCGHMFCSGHSGNEAYLMYEHSHFLHYRRVCDSCWKQHADASQLRQVEPSPEETAQPSNEEQKSE